jgi:glycosyltransferase involved in cell wall biosynthesis
MTARTRVATVVTRFQAGAGGVALRGALALDRLRYEVTIVAGSGNRLLDDAAEAGLEVLTVPSLVPELSPGRDARALSDLTRLIGKGRYDVVHTHSAKAGTLGRLAALRNQVPVVVHTFHGFPFHDFQSGPRRNTYVAIERWLGRHTDAFLAVGSGVAAEAVRRRLAAPHRIRTIGAVVGPVQPATRAARAAVRRMLGARPGVSVVGTVGRLDFQKAPEHFVEAIAALDRDDVLAVWVGDGPLREPVSEQIERRGLTDRVLLLGERKDVPELLAGFDLFAMASRYEGLPCAVVEAMSARIPVVATAVNSVPDVVVPGETGLLVPPAQPRLLADAIRHLLDHPAEGRRLAANAAANLGDRFEPSSLGLVLDAVYRTEPRRGGGALPRLHAA